MEDIDKLAKVKTKELINKFLRIEDDTFFYWDPGNDMRYTNEEVLPHAKKCALMCVEEIKQVLRIQKLKLWDEQNIFWAKVKEEINDFEI